MKLLKVKIFKVISLHTTSLLVDKKAIDFLFILHEVVDLTRAAVLSSEYYKGRQARESMAQPIVIADSGI